MIKEKLKNKKALIALALVIFVSIAVIFFLTNRHGGVEAFVVSEAPFAEKIIAIGQLGLEQETTLIAEVSGRVEATHTKEGQTTSSGAILLEIENQVTLEYESAQSELSRASSRRAFTSKAYKNAVALYSEGAVSENEMRMIQLDDESALAQFYAAKLKLEQVKEDLSQYLISAPWDAVILKTYVNVGDYVQVGEPLVDIGSVGGYKISAELDEKYFPYISKGLPVAISVGDGYGGIATGSIDNITPKINANTGTFEINILIPHDYLYKASNLTVNLEIKVNEAENAIAIPQNYIIEKVSSDKAFVLVYKQGLAVKTPIATKPGISSTVLVSDGLSEGDVLLLPNDDLKDGDKVKKYKEASAS